MLSEETSAPARSVKFHYEINPGKYSYSQEKLAFFIIIYHSFLLHGRRHCRPFPFSTLSQTVINIVLPIVSHLEFLLLFLINYKARKSKDAAQEYTNIFISKLK